jgi:protein SERAC1
MLKRFHLPIEIPSEGEDSLPEIVFPCGIKTLHDPDDAVADIVLVHGLTGDRIRTWTSADKKVFWSSDFPPEQGPEY